MKRFIAVTLSAIVMAIGIYVFRFPNGFSFGGVSGLSVVLAKLLPLSAGTFNLIFNALLLILGVILLGKSFAVMSVYVTVVFTLSVSAMERWFPMQAPLTDEPFLEFIFAILLPAAAAAVLFHFETCSGGTDVVALLVQKYTHIPIGTALLLADGLIAASSFFVYGVKIGLYSVLGLLINSLVIDNVIESIRISKYFTVICQDPDPITQYITQELDSGATVFRAEGAYTHENKVIVLAVLHRFKAARLRKFIKKREPNAFVMISNISEIVGKGFHE